MISQYKNKEIKGEKKAISRPTEVWNKACTGKMPVCRAVSQGENRALKSVLHLFWSVSPLLDLFLPPASWHWELTCPQQRAEQLLHPTSETQEAKRCCSATGERATWPSWDSLPHVYSSLPQTTTLPEYFGSLLLSLLSNRAVSNTGGGDTFRRHRDLLQMPEKKGAARLRKDKTCQGCKEKRDRSAEWLDARSAFWVCSDPLRLSLPKHLGIISADWL